MRCPSGDALRAMNDEVRRAQVAVADLLARLQQFDAETARDATERIVAPQPTDAMTAQCQRDQGLISAEIPDGSDTKLSGFDAARARQVTRHIACHVLDIHQSRALHPTQQIEPRELFGRWLLDGV